MSAKVSLVTMPPKRTMESFFTAASKRSCQHIENKTAANEVEVGREAVIKVLGGADKKWNVQFYLQPPRPKFLFRFAAAAEITIIASVGNVELSH